MNDAEYQTQVDRVTHLLDWWVTPTGLAAYRLRYTFYRSGFPDEPRSGTHCSIVARTRANWRYLDANIEWDIPEVEKCSDKDLEYMVLHELMHVHVNELMTGCEHEEGGHEERVCTQLALAFQWVRRAAESETIHTAVDTTAASAPAPTPPFIPTHYSVRPFSAVCDQDKAHHPTTGVRAHVTCPDCLDRMQSAASQPT